MCGRFSQTDPERIVREFSVTGGDVHRLDVGPRYNVAPSQLAAVVLVRAPGGPRELAFFKWGYVVSARAEPRAGGMINARAESVAHGGPFRGALESRRCLVVADGFYEWQRRGRESHPYYLTRPDGRLVAMAGLWNRFTTADGEVVETFAVVTKPSSAPVEAIHDRMPAVLDERHHDTWLAPGRASTRELEGMLLGPSPSLSAVSVGPYVNKPANEGPECVEPVSEQPGLFDRPGPTAS